MKTNLQTFLDKYVVATSHAEATDAFVDLVVEILGDAEPFDESETSNLRAYCDRIVRNTLREVQMERLEELCKEES